MRDAHGGDHGEHVGGVPEHDLLPQGETWHEGEHTRSESSVLGCQGPNKDHLSLFPGPLGGLQPQLMSHPWMEGGGSGGWCERGRGGEGVKGEGEHVGVKDDVGDEEEGGRQGCLRKMWRRMRGQG